MAVAQAMDDPQKGAHLPSQAIADLLRKSGESDFAFVPAGVVRNVNPSGDLAEVLEYPTDQVCVVELKGSQIKLALERSEFEVERCNWIPFDEPSSPVEAMVKIRYNHPGTAAVVEPLGSGRARVRLLEPQRAITP